MEYEGFAYPRFNQRRDFLNSLGLMDRLRRNVDDLARYTDKGVPVIVRITDVDGGTSFSHFVVVDGVTTRNGTRVVAIRDPNNRAYFSPVETFSRNFTGEVVLPKPRKN
ncbi:hypothetical protein F2P45_33975 [Massilia sp. CCM 8733]|uniref:Peptidase C39-like domain-containing protein n=1 Tax=Massilia mucilaginosa TaxID=2609282 RepID=A0ABX0P3Q0_9BURK|nr:hypothetical protein [Massilia mucilaginosa]